MLLELLVNERHGGRCDKMLETLAYVYLEFFMVQLFKIVLRHEQLIAGYNL